LIGFPRLNSNSFVSLWPHQSFSISMLGAILSSTVVEQENLPTALSASFTFRSIENERMSIGKRPKLLFPCSLQLSKAITENKSRFSSDEEREKENDKQNKTKRRSLNGRHSFIDSFEENSVRETGNPFLSSTIETILLRGQTVRSIEDAKNFFSMGKVR
jgi:hypothetical protein